MDQQVFSKIKWYEKIYFWFYRRYYAVVGLPREIKWLFKRAFLGYADCDVWGLDDYLASWLPQAIRHLKKNQTGCPQSLYKKYGEKGHREWQKVLEKMALGFESHTKISNLEYVVWAKDNKVKKIDRKKYRQLEKQMKEGLKLFVEHYQGLWS